MENLGLVGFTGAGANRLFSALTGLPAPSEYEAAVGIATVPDERLDRLAAMSESKKVVPAGFELVHLALPPGAKPGEGLGSKFLGALRNTDAILIVLRAFAESGVEPDAEGDLAAIELELVMADVTTVESRIERHRKALKARDPEVVAEVAVLERVYPILSEGTPLYRAGLTAEEREILAPVFLLTTKPVLVVCNTGEERGHRRADRGRARGADRHRSRDRRDRPRRPRRDARDVRRRRVRARAGRARGVPLARATNVLDHRRQGVARVDVPRRCQGT